MTLFSIAFIGLLVQLVKNINDLLAPKVRRASKPEHSYLFDDDRSGLSLSLFSCADDHIGVEK